MDPVRTKPSLLPALWRELLVPALVALGLVLILASLIEGPAIQDFLYAIF
jgi:hypothetical protein